MRRRTIDLTATTTASPEAVYGLLADGASWPRWSPIESFALVRAGDGTPEGVGAIRELRKGRTVGRDQIVALVPNRKLTYSSEAGLPVRDYVGEIELESAAGGGTTIHWSASFTPQRPGTGWIIERGVRRFLTGCIRGLARYADTVGGVPQPFGSSA